MMAYAETTCMPFFLHTQGTSRAIAHGNTCMVDWPPVSEATHAAPVRSLKVAVAPPVSEQVHAASSDKSTGLHCTSAQAGARRS